MGTKAKRVCSHPNCYPVATNAIGVEIQEYRPKQGWVGVSEPYPTNCLARKALEAYPNDGIERRVYTALKPIGT